MCAATAVDAASLAGAWMGVSCCCDEIRFGAAPRHLAPPKLPPPPHLPPDHNIFKMVKELGIPWPFTDFERSGFWGRGGKLITEVRVAFAGLMCGMQAAAAWLAHAVAVP